MIHDAIILAMLCLSCGLSGFAFAHIRLRDEITAPVRHRSLTEMFFGADPAFGPADPSRPTASRPIGFNPGERKVQ